MRQLLRETTKSTALAAGKMDEVLEASWGLLRGDKPPAVTGSAPDESARMRQDESNLSGS